MPFLNNLWKALTTSKDKTNPEQKIKGFDNPEVEAPRAVLDDNYIFDFKGARWRDTSAVPGIYVSGTTQRDSEAYGEEQELKLKIMVKPIDVIKELEMAPRVFALDNILIITMQHEKYLD